MLDLSTASVGYIHEFLIHEPLPEGWAKCEGKMYHPKSYPDLFKKYGTIFGGDGVTTFGTPDFRENKLDVNMEVSGREFMRTYKAFKMLP